MAAKKYKDSYGGQSTAEGMQGGMRTGAPLHDGMNYKSAKKRGMAPGSPSVPSKGSGRAKYMKY